MPKVQIYTTNWCPYCSAAKSLLSDKGVPYEEIDVTDPRLRVEMMERAHGRRTVPQIFVGDTHVGGYDDMAALERRGQLDPLLAWSIEVVRVATLQMTSGTAPGPNIEALARLAREAAAQGAQYALSPEVTVVFAENRDGLSAVAGPWADNPAVAQVADIARQTGLFLHLGSLAVALPDGRFANRSVLFRPDGVIAATYDKIHLFDATLPGVKPYRESETYAGGERAVVAAAAGMRVGLTICYDVRFPALHRALAEAGAEVLAVPSAFTVPTGEAHWEVLLRARAIETGCFVIAAAQAGRHQNGRATYGHSMIVDPWGRVLGQLGGDGEGVLVADLDLGAVAEARRKVPALANGRAFSLSVNPAGAS